MTARIYVGTYAKYNSGSIDGAWLDLEDYSDKEEFYAACKELHKDEEDPEFMFQDWEGIPEGMVSESSIDDEVFELANMADDDRELLTVYRENVNQEGTLEQAQEEFRGKYKDASDYAYDLVEEGCFGEIADSIKNYIDYDAIARDLGYDGYSFVNHEGDCWVFSN